MTPHLLILSKDDRTLVTFRKPLILQWLECGYKLTIISPFLDLEIQNKLKSLGVNCYSFDLKGTKISPILDIKNLLQLVRLFKQIKPTHALFYFAKPVIWGSVAARFARINRVFCMIEGLGFAFTSNKQERFSIKKWILSKFISTLYKIALKRVTKVLFLNQDDLEFFKNNQLIRPDQAYLLGPIGLNLQDWPQKKYTSVLGRPICFIFVGRLLKEKGLPTLIEAARILKPSIEKGLLKIQVLGAPDQNPSAISLEEVKTWHQEGLIEYLGATQNVRPYLDETDVFVLPSWYGEGFPMSAQEASSVGLPIITTRSVGCKETVKEGKNGFLFEPRDSKSLTRLMEFFIENPSKIEDLGQESRKIAELNYDSKKINDRLIKLFVGDF